MEITGLTPIVEGFFRLDGGAMFGIIPKAVWERTNPADSLNRIALAARCWLVELGSQLILCDGGIGNKWSERELEIYDIQHPHGDLTGAIRAAGFEPEAITDVIISHLHFDHVGGLTNFDQAGQAVPVLPQARHHVQRLNWEWAQQPSWRDRGSYRAVDFECFGNPGGPELVIHDGPGSILPGIEVLLSGGHTPGMQCPLVRLDGRPIIFMADLLPTRGHLNLAYSMGYDLFPLDNLREKRAVLELVMRENGVLGLEHDPEISFVQVECSNSRYTAEPTSIDLGSTST